MSTCFETLDPHFGQMSRKRHIVTLIVYGVPNGVLLLLFSRTNSESQSGKVIHKKSVGKAGNSNFLNFPLSPLILYVLLSLIDFQSQSVNIIVTEPHCDHICPALKCIGMQYLLCACTAIFMFVTTHHKIPNDV